MSDPSGLDPYDLVIVGGGPAGLSAALSLVRARRRVLVVDARRPRNAVAPHMHGVLGHDGLPPLELLERGRAEILGYGGRIVEGEVTGARPADDGIVIDTPVGAVRARRLLVATGAHDELPDIPRLGEHWGRGVVVCPYCDGWEHREDVIGVIATSAHSVQQAQMLRQWSDRVVYLPHLAPRPDADETDALRRRGIRIHPGTVTGLRIDGNRVTGVELVDRIVEVGVVFTGPTLRPHDELLRGLGATTTRGPQGEWVEVDVDGRTSIRNVWAVGNVVDPRANVPVSLGAGSLIAGAINADLIADDIARA